ncbi:hypothetical protein DI09_513p10, partial [Mitosporidium daphniae]
QDAKDIDILKNHLSKLLQAINDINKNTNAFVIELKQKKAGALEKVTVKKDGKYEKSEALKKILRDIKIKENYRYSNCKKNHIKLATETFLNTLQETKNKMALERVTQFEKIKGEVKSISRDIQQKA